MRKPKPTRRSEGELTLTAMIDVTFLLLVFFLCTLQFRTLDGKLSAFLPRDRGVHPVSTAEREDVVVRARVVEAGRRIERSTGAPWDGSGAFDFAGRRIGYRVGPLETEDPEILLTRVRTLHLQDPEREAVIRAGVGVVYEDVVTVLDALAESGYSEVTFEGLRAR